MKKPDNFDPATMPSHELLEMARWHGIHWYAFLGSPNAFLIWGGDGAICGLIVAALRDRRDELLAMIAANRPAPLPLSEAEERYRADVLLEPNIPIGELPWPVLKAMIVGIVFDAIAIERESVERQRQHDEIVARDAGKAVRP